jgi:cytidylate kinase
LREERSVLKYVTDRTNEVDEEVRCVLEAEQSSDDGKEVTPVPIPNTEVKLFCADGSWGIPPARVGRRWAQNKEVVIE